MRSKNNSSNDISQDEGLSQPLQQQPAEKCGNNEEDYTGEEIFAEQG